MKNPKTTKPPFCDSEKLAAAIDLFSPLKSSLAGITSLAFSDLATAGALTDWQGILAPDRLGRLVA